MFGAMTYALTVHAGLLILAAVPYSATTVMATIAGIAMALPLAAAAVSIVRSKSSRCGWPSSPESSR